jgi:DtxR family transcriptional regulator, manganese transport regulator
MPSEPVSRKALPPADSQREHAISAPAERFRGTRRAHRDETCEDYVEAIAELSEQSQVVAGAREGARVTDLARMMGVSHVTVVRTIARLKKLNLVVGERGRPIHLTPAGAKLAAASKRRHVIVMEFLRAIGVPARQAELDAEGIEHHVSEATISAMTKAMSRLAGAREPRERS